MPTNLPSEEDRRARQEAKDFAEYVNQKGGVRLRKVILVGLVIIVLAAIAISMLLGK